MGCFDCFSNTLLFFREFLFTSILIYQYLAFFILIKYSVKYLRTKYGVYQSNRTKRKKLFV